MNENINPEKFHLYLYCTQTDDHIKSQLHEYYTCCIVQDELKLIKAMDLQQLSRKIKYDGFERPIIDFDFDELIREYISRGIKESQLVQDIASIFNSTEYLKLLDDYTEWINRNKIPPLPEIDKQVEVLLPNFSTLVISSTNKLGYYSIFVSSTYMVDSSLVEKRLDRLLREIGQAEVTLVQLESIYNTLFYI